MMQVQVFNQSGTCARGDQPARLLLVRDGKEEALCQDHFREELVSDPALVAAVLVDLLEASARPRTGQLYPR